MTAAPGALAESRVRRHAVWACVAAAYLIVFPYFQRLNNPNENVRVWMTRAIVEHGTFAIDAVEREWGATSDRAAFGGKHFSGKAPGTSLLGVPVLFVETKLLKLFGAGPSQRATIWALRVFSVALPLGWFLFLFARAVERETGSAAARDLLVLGLGLGTMLYPYGLLFVGHAQSAALLFGSYLCARAPSPRRLALAGLLAGFAVVFEYQSAFAALAVALFVVWTARRRALFFAAGALPAVLLLGAYHAALFGDPFSTPLAHVDDPVFALYHQHGFLGMGWPKLQVLPRALFSADYGLFAFSPFLAAGLATAVALSIRARAHRADFALAVGITAAMLIFLCGLANWRGGWCAGGPRYIAVVVPFLVWSLALSWSWWQAHPWRRVALAGLVAVSVIFCTLAGAVFPHYPMQLDNPTFDLVLPLIADGYAPYSLGRLLGLSGVASYLPLALLVAGALALALPREPRRIGPAAALMLAGVLFAAMGIPGRGLRFDERHATAFVRDVWEPGAPRTSRADGTF